MRRPQLVPTLPTLIAVAIALGVLPAPRVWAGGPLGFCGDGRISGFESCDGFNLGGATCQSFGFIGGQLSCTNLCAFDTSGCVSAICGDGVVETGEQCDDGAANGTTGSCCSSSCGFQDCSFGASKDSFLRTSQHNTNEGASNILSLQKTGHHRPVVAFDLSSADTAAVVKATLVLTIRSNLKAWGTSGRAVEVHGLNQDFTEGNGKNFRQTSPARGSGPGVTFECSTDQQVANVVTDCSGPAAWNGGDFTAGASDSVTITNQTKGEVSFDVTGDVKNGKSEWLLKAGDEESAGGVLFYSREGAAAASNPAFAPRLDLDYGGVCLQGVGQC